MPRLGSPSDDRTCVLRTGGSESVGCRWSWTGMEEDGLLDRAGGAIRSGRVPGARGLKRVWCGASEGATCVICELSIDHGDIEVQGFFRDPARDFHFHVHCFNAWDTARFL